MAKSYLFVYDNSLGTLEQVKDFLNSISLISHWRIEMPNCFFVVSEASSQDLADFLIKIAGGGGRFVFAEYTYNNSQGLLTEQGWYLLNFKQYHPSTLK